MGLIRRTFLDPSVLIAAYKSHRELHNKAKELLLSSDREFLASSIVRLELSQPHHDERHSAEAEFYEAYLTFGVTECLAITESLVVEAISTVKATGAAAIDAIHLTCAIQMGADEFVTCERKGRPMYRESRIRITWLGDV